MNAQGPRTQEVERQSSTICRRGREARADVRSSAISTLIPALLDTRDGDRIACVVGAPRIGARKKKQQY